MINVSYRKRYFVVRLKAICYERGVKKDVPQVSICGHCQISKHRYCECRYSFADFRSSLAEKPNLELVSRYSTFFRNQKGKIKDIFPGKLSILTLGELLEYITSKHENVGNFLQFLLCS